MEHTIQALNDFKSALANLENSEYYNSLSEGFRKIQRQAIETEIEMLKVYIRKESRKKRKN